jgi:flagellar basal-body rod protein FlgG
MALQALSTAVTGMRAQQTNVDVIANNIANVNTSGFKKARARFEDLFYQEIRRAGGKAPDDSIIPTGIEIGTGVRLAGTLRDFRSGSPFETKAPLDLFIQGEGFFEVRVTPDQVGYTRDGSFTLDNEGNIVTKDGFKLEPPIQVDMTNAVAVQVSQDGIVQTIDASNNVTDVGQINLARFLNTGGLEAQGDNVFLETPASGPPITGVPNQSGFGKILGGFIEESNVDIVEEMVSLISAQRAFEVNSNSIKVADQMLQVANTLRQ